MQKIFFLFTVSIFLNSCSEKDNTNKMSIQKRESKNIDIFTENKNSEYAKKELENAKISNEFSPTEVIPNSTTAVEISESILFPIYVKKTLSDKDLTMLISLMDILLLRELYQNLKLEDHLSLS